MIIITGAAGFIGSNFCKKLNFHGIHNIILVDDFSSEMKRKNWEDLQYEEKIHRDEFLIWAEKNVQYIDYIFHLGARTNFIETNYDFFEQLNVDFSQRVWSFAALKRIPLVYSSSYLARDLMGISPFAKSKLVFDKWVEKQMQTPPFWAGLKLFQVYGKNEEHKENNASEVYKIFKQNSENVTTIYFEKNIFKDYIYVNDVTKVLFYFFNHAPRSGIYEVGSGFARPISAIIDALNRASKREEKLMFACRKEDDVILQADLSHLRKYAYKQPFLTLEQGVKRMF